MIFNLSKNIKSKIKNFNVNSEYKTNVNVGIRNKFVVSA